MKMRPSFVFFICGAFWVISGAAQEPARKASMLEVKDHLIFYEDAGAGPPVLLLHGGYLSHGMWDSQVAHLNESGYRTIRYDELGHGASVSGKEDILGHEVISALLSELKIDRVSIVGLSWGAVLAVDFAIAQPVNVEKLVLLSPGMSGWDYFQDPVAQANYDLRKQKADVGDRVGFANAFQLNWTFGPGQKASRVEKVVREEILGMVLSNTQQHWQADWSTLTNPPVRNRLGEIASETLIILGSLDVTDIAEISAVYDAEIANSELIVIEGVGHTLNLEVPRKVNEMIGDFLNR